MATIADLKKSFLQLTVDEQYALIEAIRLSRQTPKEYVKNQKAKKVSKQIKLPTATDVMKILDGLADDVKEKILKEHGII